MYGKLLVTQEKLVFFYISVHHIYDVDTVTEEKIWYIYNFFILLFFICFQREDGRRY